MTVRQRAARVSPQPSSAPWAGVDAGAAGVAVAGRDALGTDVRVAVWPPGDLGAALAAVDTELRRLDEQASRFRGDSEISRAHRTRQPAHRVSRGLAEAVRVALAAARWTGGLVDPTVGGALSALGYDRDFASIGPAGSGDPLPPPGPVPGWRSVSLAGAWLRIPAGVRLDLGATAKGLGADRAATAAWRACRRGGVLVSLGGDIAVAGAPPAGGWPVAVADSSLAAAAGEEPAQVIRLTAGAVATSSVTCRQWRRGDARLHHIVDPRTGYPATGPWRTVSVAAPSCATANAAATAAIVAGRDAPAWLAATGLPARLASHDGAVLLLGGWPGAAGEPAGVDPVSNPQWLWFISRGSGLVLLVLLTAVVMLGVAARRDGSAPPRWPRFVTAELHRTLSLFTVGLLALHVVTAIADPYVAIGWAATAVPFLSPYRTVAIGLGTLAVDLGAAVLVTSVLRHRLGLRAWRAVHWLAYLAWPTAFAHALRAGGDLRTAWVAATVWGCAAAVAAALAARLRPAPRGRLP